MEVKKKIWVGEPRLLFCVAACDKIKPGPSATTMKEKRIEERKYVVVLRGTRLRQTNQDQTTPVGRPWYANRRMQSADQLSQESRTSRNLLDTI